MFLFGISDGTGAVDPLILLFLALIVEAYAGQLSVLARIAGHPTSVIADFVNWFDHKLNRETRSQGDRAVRGAIAALVLVAASLIVGWCIAWLSRNFPFAWVLELILLVMLISQRGISTPVLMVGRALRDEGLEPARQKLSRLVKEAPEKMDEHSIVRAGIETLTIAFAERAVAPVFWYVLFGFPGLLTFVTVSQMAAEIGHKTERHKAFGFTAARLNDILLLIPAPLSGLFLVLASLFTPSANPIHAVRTMLKDAGNYRSLSKGWPLGAMAGALGFALGGPRKFTQATISEPWVGSGTAQVTHQDIRRALYLFAVACLINSAWVGALALIRMI